MNEENRKELVEKYKQLIKDRAELRMQIDCIDIDIREIERYMCNYPLEPRCW